MSDGQWVCLSLDPKHVRRLGDLDELKRQVGACFGSDCLDVVIMGDQLAEFCVELATENYVFVRCRDYFNHASTLKSCKLIRGVLDSYNSPSFVSNDEMSVFRDTVEAHEQTGDLLVGDVVRIREGKLKNLQGVIVATSDSHYVVFFKLFTRRFSERIFKKNLVWMGSIFDMFKFPVVELLKNVSGEHLLKSGDVAPVALEAYLRARDEN